MLCYKTSRKQAPSWVFSWDFFSESSQQSYDSPGRGENLRLRKRSRLSHKYTAPKWQIQGWNSCLSEFKTEMLSFSALGFPKRSDREAKAVSQMKPKKLAEPSAIYKTWESAILRELGLRWRGTSGRETSCPTALRHHNVMTFLSAGLASRLPFGLWNTGGGKNKVYSERSESEEVFLQVSGALQGRLFPKVNYFLDEYLIRNIICKPHLLRMSPVFKVDVQKMLKS